MHCRSILILQVSLCLCALLLGTRHIQAADWPMWHYDAARTAASPEVLPAEP